MVMPVNQKFAATGRAVPVLWRDCAWRVRIFVRTRIGAKRPMAMGRLLVGREIPGLPGLKIWTAVSRRCNSSNPAPVSSARSAACRRTAAVSKTSHREGIDNPLLLAFGTAAVRGTARHAFNRVPLPVRVAHIPRRKQTVARLQPVLAFAASQLGGIALSRLRIYSVFQ
jgi:hypothetical protein